MAAFQRAITALPLESKMEPGPAVRFRSRRRTEPIHLRGGPGGDYSKWPLFGGPFLEAGVDSEELLIEHGTRRRLLDFRRPVVQDFE